MSTEATHAIEPDGRTDPIDHLEFSPHTGKRATHEAFRFEPEPGAVTVRNDSYGDDADAHAYRVTLDGRGVPVRCTCPADAYHDGACKHRVAVALAGPVRDAATPTPVPDGGIIEAGADDGAEILPPAPEYTYHVEPAEQGGEEYVRCEACGAEILLCLGGTDSLIHVAGCPHGEGR